MAYFPLFIDLEGKTCAVIGGGKVAEGKIRQLLEFGGKVTVTAPAVTEQIALWQEEGRLRIQLRTYRPEDIEGAALVVAATDDTGLQRQVAERCKERQIPVNVVDVKELCTFFFPAIVKREDVVVAVSTGGSSPALAARMRRELEEVVTESYGKAAGILGNYREYVLNHVPDGNLRRQIFEKMLDTAITEGNLTQEEVDNMIQNMSIPVKIRIGTRGSKLALIQTDLFIEEINKIYPQIQCEKVIIKTQGDKILNQPLVDFGGKGVFVTEFEELIQSGEIDYAVHSAKDMPMELAEGLGIVCVLPRADVRDVLVTRKNEPLSREKKAVIGTGSLRRQLQIGQLYPLAEFRGLRGNIGTRLEKLKNREYDGVVLAAAGLKRAGLDDEEELEYTCFEPEQVIPAGGQAVIAIEGKKDSRADYLQWINDKTTAQELEIERYVLQKLGAGCHEAVGVYAKITVPENTQGMETPSCLMTRDIVLPEKTVQLSVFREDAGNSYKKVGKTVLRDWKNLADTLIEQVL